MNPGTEGGVIGLDVGTYAVYKGQLLRCTINGDKVRITTTNTFLALLLRQPVYKWGKALYHADIPITKLKELYEIEKEYLYKGVFYPLFSETDEAYNVLLPRKIIKEDGIENYLDPREPIVFMPKTGNETIRETKTVLHPFRDTRIRIIGPVNDQENDQANDEEKDPGQ